MAGKSDFVIIKRVQGQAIASVIMSHLESEGIPVILKYESAGIIYALTVDGLGEVNILVPQEVAEDAKKIIEPMEVEETED